MYHIIVGVLQPYPLLLLLLWLAWANLWRQRRETRRRLLLVLVPLLGLTLLSLPLAAYLADGTLEWRYTPLAEVPADAGAIVVLGGAALPADRVRPRAELAPDSLYRCLHGLELHRQRNELPVLVSGGNGGLGSSAPAVAEVMADFLRRLGVEDRCLLVEAVSCSTHENAVEAAKRLEQRNVRKVVLVTDARHMLRSECCFRKQGLEVVPAPCAHQATGFGWRFYDFIPDPNALADCESVAHEWLGIVWYWLHGRI